VHSEEMQIHAAVLRRQRGQLAM